MTLLPAAAVVTGAELVRSLVSWELAVSLAPADAQASYLGVAGMAQAVERSAGPVVLSTAYWRRDRSAGSASGRW